MKIRPRAANAILIEVENAPESMTILRLEIHETGEGITIRTQDNTDMLVEKRVGPGVPECFRAYSIRLKPIKP